MKKQNHPITARHVIKGGKLIYSEITIRASADRTWRVFTNFEDYPAWNPFIRSLKGIPAEGQRIEVFLQPPGNKGMVFKPKVLVFEPGNEFRWIGRFILPGLFDGEHTFMLQDNGDGTCTFMQFERFSGLLVPFLKSMLDKNTLDGFHRMNEALKKRCEE